MAHRFYKSTRITQFLRYILDEFIPPIVRDNKWFYSVIIKLYNSKLDLNFKKKVVLMSEEEFTKLYELLPLMRETDMTNRIKDFIISNLYGETVLEIGCGNGDMAIACALQNKKVVATDITEKGLIAVRNKGLNLNIHAVKANIENLPFREKSFNTVICVYTLEHVRNLYLAVNEIKRVAQNRIIIIVPRQRYFKYTCDYHINFFYGEEQLSLLFDMKNSRSTIINNSICFIAEIN